MKSPAGETMTLCTGGSLSFLIAGDRAKPALLPKTKNKRRSFKVSAEQKQAFVDPRLPHAQIFSRL
jgi:hypothetical protein